MGVALICPHTDTPFFIPIAPAFFRWPRPFLDTEGGQDRHTNTSLILLPSHRLQENNCAISGLGWRVNLPILWPVTLCPFNGKQKKVPIAHLLACATSQAAQHLVMPSTSLLWITVCLFVEQMVHLWEKGTIFSTGNGKTKKRERERKGRRKQEGREEKLGQRSCPQAGCSQVQETACLRLQIM